MPIHMIGSARATNTTVSGRRRRLPLPPAPPRLRLGPTNDASLTSWDIACMRADGPDDSGVASHPCPETRPVPAPPGTGQLLPKIGRATHVQRDSLAIKLPVCPRPHQ